MYMFCTISRLCWAFKNPEIEQAIWRLCNTCAQSPDYTTIVRNLRILRIATYSRDCANSQIAQILRLHRKYIQWKHCTHAHTLWTVFVYLHHMQEALHTPKSQHWWKQKCSIYNENTAHMLTPYGQRNINLPSHFTLLGNLYSSVVYTGAVEKIALANVTQVF